MADLKPDDSERPEECDSCQFSTESLKPYESTRAKYSKGKEPPFMWLCALCAGTVAGNAYEYPEQFNNASTLRAICYVGNAILAAIKAGDA